MNYRKIITENRSRWKVIAHLLMQYDCKVVAELGFSRGDNVRNVLNMLAANKYSIEKYYLIDLAETEQIEFYGGIKEAERFFHDYSRLKSCTFLMQGSQEAAKTVEDFTLDFIFMDGDTSSYESVKEDIVRWLPKLKVGGIMVGRYFNLTPEIRKVRTDYIKKVVDELFNPQYITLHLLQEKNSGINDYMWVYKND